LTLSTAFSIDEIESWRGDYPWQLSRLLSWPGWTDRENGFSALVGR